MDYSENNKENKEYLDIEKIFSENNNETISSNYTKLDIDLLWGLPEKLYKANILIPLYNFLITSIPLYDLNSDDVIKDLGFDKNTDIEYINKIQEINNQIRELSEKAQGFCKQQYIINRQAQDILDDVINDLLSQGQELTIEGDKLENILNLLMDGQNRSSIENQKGGMSQTYIIKMIIILIILLNTSSYSFTNINTPAANSPKLSQTTKFVEEGNLQLSTVFKQPIKTSETVSVAAAQQLYDEEKKKFDSGRFALITTLGGYLTKPSAKELLQNIITEFNKKSIVFEKESTEICNNLIEKARSEKVFLDFKQITTYTEIEETRDRLKVMNEEIMNEETNLQDYLAGLGLGIITGDPSAIGGAVLHSYNAIEIMLQKYLNPKTFEDELKQNNIMNENSKEGSLITAEEKDLLEDYLFRLGRTACHGTFQLQIKYNETDNNILVLGDHISYADFINYSKKIIQNIELTLLPIITKKTQLTVKEKSTLNVLTSLRERFEVLMILINKLNEIINFAAYGELNKRLEINPGPESFDTIKSFFDSQLSSLQEILQQLRQEYPMQFSILKQSNEALKEQEMLNNLQIEIKEREQNIINQEKEYANKEKIIQAKLDANSTLASAEAFNVYLDSYYKIGTNFIDNTGEKLNEFSSKLVKAIASGPLGAMKGVGDIFVQILKYLLLSPGGLTILCIFLVSLWLLGFWQLNTIIRIVRTSWGFLLCIIRGPFVFFYYLIRTPLGFLCRHAATYFNPNINNNLLLQNAVVQPENAIVQPENAVVQPENAVVQPENAVVQPENAIVQPENVVAQPENNIVGGSKKTKKMNKSKNRRKHKTIKKNKKLRKNKTIKKNKKNKRKTYKK